MRARRLLPLAVVLVLAFAPGAARARNDSNRSSKGASPTDTRVADSLASHPLDGARRHALESWARSAPLADLMWVLRRTSSELGSAEPLLLESAIAACPDARVALRRRLVARLGRDPRSRGKRGEVVAISAIPRPAASVFRVGVMLPDSGDYADYARELWVGLEAGMASVAPTHAAELEFWPTGDDDPARTATAIDWGSQRCGTLVGELLSTHTQALATGARLLGLPLISPTATDETIGAIGPNIFQIGPSGWSRGERLARALLHEPGLRVGVLTSGPPEHDPLALGFAARAESLGATVEFREGYTSAAAFREEVRAIGNHKLDVLLWDGESRDAEALVRELTRQKVSVRLCGGEGLAPERMHADVRPLLEGVRYVADEWRLPGVAATALDSTVRARGGNHVTPLHARGWLTGRALAAALAAGALCPEEVVATLGANCGPPPWLASHRFLDVARDGAVLELFAVQRGKGVPQSP